MDQALRQRVEILLGQVVERDQRIEAFERNGTAHGGSPVEATAELESRIEALQTENAELARRLPERRVLVDRQRAIYLLQQQLDQAGSKLGERDSEIAGLTARLDALSRKAAKAAGDQSRAQVAERDLQLATSNARLSDLEAAPGRARPSPVCRAPTRPAFGIR